MAWEPVEVFDRLAKTIFGELQRAGRGSVEDVEQALGHSPGYLRTTLKPSRRSLKVLKLLEVLSRLGIHPVRFFRLAFDDEESQAAGSAPTVSRDPVADFGKRGRMIERRGMAARIAWPLERFEATMPCPPMRDAELHRLEELDALRYEDPRGVLRPAEWLCRRALESGHLELAVRAAGVIGSAMRLTRELDGAQIVLFGAYQAAERHALNEAAANLVQRMAYTTSDLGDYDHAFALAEQASLRYADLGDPIHLAQTQVDRGVMLSYLGKQEAAIRCFSSALCQATCLEAHNRYTALHGMAIAHLWSGRIGQASYFLREAESFLPHSRHARGRHLWLRAAISAQMGDAQCAEQLYRGTLEVFAGAYPADIAVCSIELVYLLLRQGKPLKARGLARGIQAIAFDLPSGSVVDRVVFDLLNARRVTAKMVKDALEQIGEASLLIALESKSSRTAFAALG